MDTVSLNVIILYSYQGIRTIPELGGPRTGEGLYPGEVFEVIHTFDSVDSSSQKEPNNKNTANTFLRLADDRGWIFERHPKTGVNLIVPATGHYEIKPMQCRYTNQEVCFLLSMFVF